MGEKTVEILLATYQGERYLRAQLDSLLAQTFDRFHLTASDDGSTDATYSILSEYAARYPDRMTVRRAPKRFGNARYHFLYLMRACRADILLFADQDDVWNPDKVEKTVRAMRAAQETYGDDAPLLVFTDQTVTDESLNAIAPSLMRYQAQYFKAFDYRAILMQNVVTGCAMAVSRALSDLAGACADGGAIVMHDWWLAAVAARFGHIVYLDESTMRYRQHKGNSVGAKDMRLAAPLFNRLANLRALRQAIRGKKAQARAFHQTYRNDLTKEDEAFLFGFEKERSGIFFYLRYRRCIHGFFRFAGMALLG